MKHPLRAIMIAFVLAVVMAMVGATTAAANDLRVRIIADCDGDGGTGSEVSGQISCEIDGVQSGQDVLLTRTADCLSTSTADVETRNSFYERIDEISCTTDVIGETNGVDPVREQGTVDVTPLFSTVGYQIADPSVRDFLYSSLPGGQVVLTLRYEDTSQ